MTLEWGLCHRDERHNFATQDTIKRAWPAYGRFIRVHPLEYQPRSSGIHLGEIESGQGHFVSIFTDVGSSSTSAADVGQQFRWESEEVALGIAAGFEVTVAVHDGRDVDSRCWRTSVAT